MIMAIIPYLTFAKDAMMSSYYRLSHSPPGGWADEAFLFFRTSEFLLVKDVSVDTVRGAN
jgi:hypothetical protein